MTPSGQVLLLSGLTVFMVALGVWELWRHRKRLAAIPVRIHVNGTRGKSSVTRLIAAGLRAGGVRTLGKVTGTVPLLIQPDGTELTLKRRGRANIIEQIGVVDEAVGLECDALVIECMALNPHLQWLSEARLVNATLAVITNARADHLDVMGPKEADVAWALASMIPRNQPVLTAEDQPEHLSSLATVARDRGSELTVLGRDDVALVTADELARFDYIEHADNVALALEVCRRMDVDRAVALDGMAALLPGPGAAVSIALELAGGRRLVFVNAFAANDPESSQRLWQLARQRHPELETTVALFNCRGDRVDRSRQLAQALPGWEAPDRVALIGTGTRMFVRYAVAAGQTSLRVLGTEGADVAELFEGLIQLTQGDVLVVGMGNIGGPGLALVRYVQHRAALTTKAAA